MKIEVRNEGAATFIRPLDMEAEEWCDTNIDADRQSFGKAIEVKSCYVEDILNGFKADGGEIEE